MKITQLFAGFLTICTLSALSLSARAQSVVLDSTFGTGGKVVDGNTSASYASALVTGSKIVATSLSTFSCSRYSSTGALDTTFGNSGRAVTSFGVLAATYALAVQADGSIVIAGSASTGSATTEKASIARFTASGVLDTTFSGDGKAQLDAGVILALAIQSDGKILACGRLNDSNSRGFIYRFNSDGTLDTTFSGDGKVFADYGSLSNSTGFTSLAIQTDGKIVTVGGWFNNYVTSRFNSDGSVDTTFGTSGKVSTDLSTTGSYDSPNKVIVQGDGKILDIGGATIDSSGSSTTYVGLARYTSAGVLDTTFNSSGTPGRLLQAFGTGNTSGRTGVLLSGGSFLVSGTNNGNFFVSRFLSNGTVDTSFNSTGYVVVDFGTTSDRSYSMIYQSGGKITLVGESNFSLAMARLVGASAAATTATTPSGNSS